MRRFWKTVMIIGIVLTIVTGAAGTAYAIIGEETAASLLGAVGISWSFPIYWTVHLVALAILVTGQQVLCHIDAKRDQKE